jgi:hypothetical protein
MRVSRITTEVPSGERGHGVLDFRDRPASPRHTYDVRVEGLDQIFEVNAFNQLDARSQLWRQIGSGMRLSSFSAKRSDRS